MQPAVVQVATIHDHRGSVLALDLKDVLQVLGEDPRVWAWCITLLECTGGEYCAEICRAVENAGESGVWISGHELLQLANDIQQTIEGEWIAFPKEIDRTEITMDD